MVLRASYAYPNKINQSLVHIINHTKNLHHPLIVQIHLQILESLEDK